jgi:hypothetical protein
VAKPIRDRDKEEDEDGDDNDNDEIDKNPKDNAEEN